MRSRNGDLIDRHRRLKEKSQRNSKLKRRKLNICKPHKSTVLKCPRKLSEPQRQKNQRFLSHPMPARKIRNTNTDNDCEVDGTQAQGETGNDYVIQIERECIVNFHSYSKLSLDNVAGLDVVKQVIKECWILPRKRPDLFKGLRYPVRGVLLFGATGTGKTTLGKCIASEMRCTFLNVSPANLASKWMGETEKLIRALFAVAKYRQPSVIFIDNIDCILSPGNPQENGSMRGIANEFLVQMDSSSTSEDERIVILGATRRPQDLNPAARRRFQVRLQIPLLDEKGRKELLKMLLEKEPHCLQEKDFSELAKRTSGYSGADLKLLCQDAAMGPVRSIPEKNILRIQASKVRPINKDDFYHALSCIKASISRKELKILSEWNKQFGHKCSITKKPPVC